MILFPDKKYKIILCDPPWGYNDKGIRGGVKHHYSSMTPKQIRELPVQEIADDNCTLFLWVTYPMLPDCLTVFDSWGFKFKTIAFQWIKLNKTNGGFFTGLGHWTRSNSECCLLGIKGKPKRISKSVHQLIVEPRGIHSAKPAIVRNKIVQLMGDLPRIELFAREVVDGWDCWGDQVPLTLIEQSKLKVYKTKVSTLFSE